MKIQKKYFRGGGQGGQVGLGGWVALGGSGLGGVRVEVNELLKFL